MRGYNAYHNFLNRTAPIEHASMMDIAFLAGFYEGDGYVTTGRNNRGFCLRIVQKDKEKLKYLKAKFGGVLHTNSRGITEWCANGTRGLSLAYTIFDLVSERRKTQLRKKMEVYL